MTGILRPDGPGPDVEERGNTAEERRLHRLLQRQTRSCYEALDLVDKLRAEIGRLRELVAELRGCRAEIGRLRELVDERTEEEGQE